MDCTDAREALLEAEVEELRGQGGSALAEHLRVCPTCHAAAERILSGYAALDASLAAERPRRRLPRYLHWVEIAVPLAAAAALVLLMAHPRGTLPAPSSPAAAPATAAASPLVSAPAAQDVTVMQTDDPNIVVVWIN